MNKNVQSKKSKQVSTPVPMITASAKKAKIQKAKALNKVGFAQNLQRDSVLAPQTGGQHKSQKPMHKAGRVKVNDPAASENRLKKSSVWYASLRDPIQGGGARIPDVVGVNTATLQVVQKYTVVANSAGICGVAINPYVATTGTPNVYPVTGSSTLGSITFNLVGSELGGNSAIRAVSQSHRVVSAAVYAEYEGATLNDQGEMTSFVYPYNAILPGGTYADIQQKYVSSTTPVNKARTKPLASRWFPTSFNDREYSDFQGTTGVYGSATAPPNWWLGHICAGLTVGVPVNFTFVVNYEFIPNLNSIDYISASASPIDPIEEQLVQGWVQEDTQTGMCSNKLVDVQPGSQKTEEASQGMTAEAGFGMLGSLMKEVLPFLLAL